MPRPRDRASSAGLLPRMEARPHASSDKVTYRYHPMGGKPINLGTDKLAAIQKVLDLNGAGVDQGTVAELWRAYKLTPQWAKLSQRSKDDYTDYSVQLLKVMGEVHAAVIRPKDVARYMRVERAAAPVRANREIALLSNLFRVAIERGDVDANPTKQVKRNTETPRTESPEQEALAKFIAWLSERTKQRAVIALMAEFASVAGSRRVEFLHLTLPQIDSEKEIIRLMRAKQHGGKKKVENVEITPAVADLVRRLRTQWRPEGCLHVFVTRDGNPYTEDGFNSIWQRSLVEALETGVIEQRFTFHDLRAYYTTQHKAQYGALPEMHADAKTTARVYDRSKVSVRKGLG